MGVRVKAYAKLNLTLDITGVKDGFHMLDSLVCTVDLYDSIKLKKRKDGRVFVEMHGYGTETLPFEENNAVKAAEAYINAFSTGGADIVIYKNIPVGAGLGGSSADIAGVLTGMARLYGKGSAEDLKKLADGLGSDAGYQLSGGFARLTGRGEKIEFLDAKTRLYFLLLVPDGGVSTAECYRLYDENPSFARTTENAISALSAGDLQKLGKSLGNALFSSAAAISRGVGKAFGELENFAPSGVNMTGSGCGVYALFDSAELRDWAKSRYRGKCACLCLKSYNPK